MLLQGEQTALAQPVSGSQIFRNAFKFLSKILKVVSEVACFKPFCGGGAGN
jgi:hypothetical protein